MEYLFGFIVELKLDIGAEWLDYCCVSLGIA